MEHKYSPPVLIVYLPFAGAIVEYKYVLLDGSGGGVWQWQAGANNVLAVKLSEERLELLDTWCAPGLLNDLGGHGRCTHAEFKFVQQAMARTGQDKRNRGRWGSHAYVLCCAAGASPLQAERSRPSAGCVRRRRCDQARGAAARLGG